MRIASGSSAICTHPSIELASINLVRSSSSAPSIILTRSLSSFASDLASACARSDACKKSAVDTRGFVVHSASAIVISYLVDFGQALGGACYTAGRRFFWGLQLQPSLLTSPAPVATVSQMGCLREGDKLPILINFSMLRMRFFAPVLTR